MKRSHGRRSAKKSVKRSVRRSPAKRRSMRRSARKGGKRSFDKPRIERNTNKQMKVLDAFAAGKVTEAATIKALQELYCPTKLNLRYKKEVLDKLKAGELSKEEAERKLHFFLRLEHEFVPRNNANKKVNKKNNNNNKKNNNNNKKNNNN